MAMHPYAVFQPSMKPQPPGQQISAVAPDEVIEISLYLKPRSIPAGLGRAAFAEHRHHEHADDIAAIRAFAEQAGLHIIEVSAGRRLVRLSGTASQMQAAFKTELHHYRHDGLTFRGRTGALSLPGNLAPIVEAVLGLDTRKIAAPRLAFHPAAAPGASFLPSDVAKFYQAPPGLTGTGQCIGLIELGGGYTDSDTQAAFAAMGLPAPMVVAVPVDGGANSPTPDDGADGEVALDIQVAGGVAPGAKIAVYFSVNTDAGFVDAITAATHDATNAPAIISISWGGPEGSWSAQSQSAMTSALADAATLNISVFAASGDHLATDGVADGQAHVDFPAASPWAIGCGGTRITVAGGAITAERVWNEGTSGTGGGISAVYPVPAYQFAVALPASVNGAGPGRGVPDVAGNADPASGYLVVINGQTGVVGGTSAVAPFWAGLTALINQKAGKPAGFFLPKLYAAQGAMRDIHQGSNKPAGSATGYDATPGWDACTGLGVPIGTGLLNLLAG